MQFSQMVLNCIENTQTQQTQLWQLICGANYLKEHQLVWKKLKLHKKQHLNPPFFLYLRKFLAKWTHLVFNILQSPKTCRTQTNKWHNKFFSHSHKTWYHSWFEDNNQLQAFLRNNKINPQDIIIYLDGSFKIEQEGNQAGIGIYIIHQNKHYFFHQTLGDQTINFA